MEPVGAGLRSAGWWRSLALLAAGLVGGCQPSTPSPTASEPSETSNTVTVQPDLPRWDTPFQNVGPEVSYVGSVACLRCHADAAETYGHTAMSRSMALVDLAREPPDGTFEHPLSGRRYEVVRRDGRMWHRELKLTNTAEELVLSEYPVLYVVGSGRHSLTYLVEAEGFLVESPITWYTSSKTWGMSPGYDVADHLGFERATGQGCLECHAGRTVPIDQSLHRMQVFEAAIGCERCHGPGALHVEKHREWNPSQGLAASTAVDHSIVNPAALSRELSEAVCQQCHLRSNATIVGRGRNISDFRPGLPLEDFRQEYRLDVPDTPLTVVGHVEQMHLSRCYQQSTTLTCLTCHNPHAAAGTDSGPAHHNAICATCHQPVACRAPANDRQATTPDDNCIACHMPRADTEIPHLAFTHHRIGRHESADVRANQPEQVAQGGGTLRSFHDLSRLSPLDQRRSHGLACLEVANRQERAEIAETYRRQAVTELTRVRTEGLRDPATEAALAQLAFQFEEKSAEDYARSALAEATLAGQERCNALFVLADARLQRGLPAAALPLTEELTKLRRHPLDWLMRAQCEKQLGRDAVPSLQVAVTIQPGLTEIHKFLGEHFAKAGDQERAAWHTRRSKP